MLKVKVAMAISSALCMTTLPTQVGASNITPYVSQEKTLVGIGFQNFHAPASGTAISTVTPISTPPATIGTPAATTKPTPKPEIKYYGKKYKVWTTTAVHIRKKASKKSKSITVLSPGTKITRLGVSKKGWAKVKYKNKVRFIKNKFLTKHKPKMAGCYKPKYSSRYFKSMGVVHYGGKRWTWYSQRVLPGGGLNIPGRHLDDNGYVCDKNNYICLASNDLQKGTIINTPFGKQGKIYDCGCELGTIDTYVGW